MKGALFLQFFLKEPRGNPVRLGGEGPCVGRKVLLGFLLGSSFQS